MFSRNFILVFLLWKSWALMFLISGCESTTCYLCSWTPEENRTDYCTGDNWRPQMVGSIDCLKGCETVTQYDKNGVVNLFYRNCVNTDIATYYTQCQKIKRKGGSRLVCSCNYRYCNHASSLFNPHNYLLMMVFAAICPQIWPRSL